MRRHLQGRFEKQERRKANCKRNKGKRFKGSRCFSSSSVCPSYHLRVATLVFSGRQRVAAMPFVCKSSGRAKSSLPSSFPMVRRSSRNPLQLRRKWSVVCTGRCPICRTSRGRPSCSCDQVSAGRKCLPALSWCRRESKVVFRSSVGSGWCGVFHFLKG